MKTKQVRVAKDFDQILDELAKQEGVPKTMITKLLAKRFRGDEFFQIPEEKSKRRRNDKFRFI